MSDFDFATIVHSGSTLDVGEFRCNGREASRARSGCASGHLVVFPRTPVCITQEGRRPVVTDANVVMFYNQGCTYAREMLVDEGDCCEFFVVRGDLLEDAISEYDPSVGDRPAAPFSFTHGPAPAQAYLLQRQIYHHVMRDTAVDLLAIEDVFLLVLDHVISESYRVRGGRRRRRSTTTAHRESAEAAKEILAREFKLPLTLDDLATAVHLSPFHLCRVFKAHTGIPIHRYLLRLRLRHALGTIADPAADLTRMALELGYSSHSHFSRGFQAEFGLSPKAARRRLSRGALREMSKNLQD